MLNLIFRFGVRWFVCSLGLWIAASILGADKINYGDQTGVVVVSGLVLAVINAVIKPIVVLLSLPALLFSLGLFMIIINALMVMLASRLYGQLDVDNFSSALVAGIIIGLVNYLVSTIMEER